MNNELDKCINAVREITAEQSFTDEQILYRAQMLYLMNKLQKMEDILVLCAFAESAVKNYSKVTIVTPVDPDEELPF